MRAVSSVIARSAIASVTVRVGEVFYIFVFLEPTAMCFIAFWYLVTTTPQFVRFYTLRSKWCNYPVISVSPAVAALPWKSKHMKLLRSRLMR